MAAGVDADASASFLLRLVHDIVSVNVAAGMFRKDCTDLVRRIALFTHLLEEIRDFGPSDHDHDHDHASSSSDSSWSADLAIALQAAKRVLSAASVNSSVMPLYPIPSFFILKNMSTSVSLH
ncbi:hypothetical protein V6N12_056309 [Hibiscus sabdariffa]|uniref:PUB 12/19-like N-terminal domain-containing protein n=1 Tax=Hibiscus sabdariffa TaxID=183260 RepID=A0ABR2CS63_9ROSI